MSAELDVKCADCGKDLTVYWGADGHGLLKVESCKFCLKYAKDKGVDGKPTCNSCRKVLGKKPVAEPTQAEPPDWPALPPGARRIRPGDVPQKGDLVNNGFGDDVFWEDNNMRPFIPRALAQGDYARPLSPEPLLTASDGVGETLASEADPPAEDREAMPQDPVSCPVCVAAMNHAYPYCPLCRQTVSQDEDGNCAKCHEWVVDTEIAAAIRAAVLVDVELAWQLTKRLAVHDVVGHFDDALAALRRK